MQANGWVSTMSPKSNFPGRPAISNAAVMGNFLADAEALTAACLERVSLDDFARQAKPNSLHTQHGAHHHE
jgi:hypothetical protein